MELGQKLKQARLEMGLSQRQLCGDEITRNMLSLIENGSAQPSMDTLRYLAGRLQKPVSYFLEDVPDVSDRVGLDAAWDAFCHGHPFKALELLEEREDGERVLLRALALLAGAEEAIRQQRMPYAQRLLEQAADSCKKAPGCGQELERKRILLLFRISDQDAISLAEQLSDDSELLLRSASALRSGHPESCRALLACAGDRGDHRWIRLQADACFALGDYAGAAEYYQQIESRSLRQLEQCYEKLGDYKMAYHYACLQREP